METLEDGNLNWSGQDLTVNLIGQDSLFASSDFDKKRFNKAHFDIRNNAGEVLGSQVPFEDLSPRMKRIMRKIPELGLREMRSPQAGHLEFRLGKTSWLHYTKDPAEDAIAELEGVRMMDEHWYVLTRR